MFHVVKTCMQLQWAVHKTEKRTVRTEFCIIWTASFCKSNKMVSTLSSPSALNGFDAAREYDFSEEEERTKATYQDSDEDTEDASETDAAKLEEEYTEMKEQIYKEKLNMLKKQLQQVIDGSHPELLRKIKKLEQQGKERMRLAEVTRNAELESVEHNFIRERKEAVEEFEQKKIDLKEHLINELEDRKRNIENEGLSLDLNGGDFFEVKPVNTRKLRRRPNDPLPMPEKRRKASPYILYSLNIHNLVLCHFWFLLDSSIPPFTYLLSDELIMEDLRILSKGRSALSKKSGGSSKPSGKVHSHSNHSSNHKSSPSTSSTKNSHQSSISSTVASSSSSSTNTAASGTISMPKYNVRIDNGKLFYEKRWYHKDQNIYVESREMGKVSAVITSIGQLDIWVRKVIDNSKMRIWVSQMQKGKFKIRKRSK
ncbi:Sin3 histone deacetylase corepressor complex component SDS3 [Holothuria leucospilota]|uniref:Sin3 histone deacetylase corepressor complex component SDS3 n=1 Tax=Holothuria leucospilota TaxID=206669 RepID=A0A9Q1CEB1_HOLLE|nr:Sin3 histone deacetylase corepressor complex component SDS3 [Holothuria leucospilota]